MEKKISRKKITFLIVIVLVILLMLGGVLYYIFKPEAPIDVTVINPEIKDVIERFESSATVASSEEGTFSLVEGVMPTKVNVNVGSVVKKGDVLVEFDSSSLHNVLAQKKAELDKAQNAYNDYMRKTNSAKANLNSYDEQIRQAQKEVEKLEKQYESEKSESQQGEKTQQSNQAQEKLTELTKDKSLSEKIISFFLGDDNALTRLTKALENLENMAGNVDLTSMLSMNVTDTTQAQLLKSQLDLASLKITRSLLETESKGSLESVYKAIASYTQKAYDSAKQQRDSLVGGWIAKEDGIVSEINIKAGEKFEKSSSSGTIDISTIIDTVTSGTSNIASMLSNLTSASKSALKIEYYPLEAEFIIGQSEIANIEIGKQAKVITASGTELAGKVSYISAVAAKKSGMDISSIIGGSSSSVTGVEAKIEIEKPTKDVIIGLDVNISIEKNRAKNVVTVPVESIQYDSDRAFVYCVKKDKKHYTIYRQDVELGLFDGSCYEVVSGITSSNDIVKSPTSSMQEGTRINPQLSQEA